MILDVHINLKTNPINLFNDCIKVTTGGSGIRDLSKLDIT